MKILTTTITLIIVCVTTYVEANVDDFNIQIEESNRINQSNTLKLKPSYTFRLSKSWELELGVKLNFDYSEQQDLSITGAFFNIIYRF